jgi:bifunctional non-homologous end joining protein LigD
VLSRSPGGFIYRAGRRWFRSGTLKHPARGKLIYAGRVGTGFTEKTAVDLYKRLDAIRTPTSPFAKKLPRAEARGVCFVQPELVAEVEFRAWTTDRIVRHASFLGLRDDKQAAEVGLEAS